MNPPQHMQHLAIANRVRLGRAELKREVRAGQRTVAELIEPGAELPQEIESMRIAELLGAQRHFGPAYTRKLLRPLAIGENRKLESLTARERGKIVEALEGRQVRDERDLAYYMAGRGV